MQELQRRYLPSIDPLKNAWATLILAFVSRLEFPVLNHWPADVRGRGRGVVPLSRKFLRESCQRETSGSYRSLTTWAGDNTVQINPLGNQCKDFCNFNNWNDGVLFHRNHNLNHTNFIKCTPFKPLA